MTDEIIGNVRMNYSCYSGQDLYSDGEVEKELLNIVKKYPRSEYNKIISERKSWPILYHLSHVRGNILRQIKMIGSESVLEIGSGCGAITTTIAEQAAKVTCVDLSRTRSLINAYRNQDFSNIEIVVGNFEDIEKKITELYDVVTLIGVFEYAAYYIHSDDPYHEFLNMVLKHIKSGGKLLIAIENRLGFKYFAGCREDHLGTFFEGIEGYKNKKGIQTFSKKEWQDIFKKSGVENYTFYYPYPDYKFPMYIFSDDYLPKKEELNINYQNFDRDRIVLYDDDKVYQTLLENGLFQEFSNSYLIEIQKGKE